MMNSLNDELIYSNFEYDRNFNLVVYFFVFTLFEKIVNANHPLNTEINTFTTSTIRFK